MELLQLPKHAKPLAKIAGSLGVIQSVTAITLCCIALTSYLSCQFVQPFYENHQYMFSLVHKHYFLRSNCEDYLLNRVTVLDSFQMFIWVVIQLVLSSIWFIISACLFVYVTNKNIRYVNLTLYSWSVTTFCISCADLGLGIVFGLDYEKLSEAVDAMTTASDDFREFDNLRIGALLMMFISLRGFVLLVMNIVLFVYILHLSFEINRVLNNSKHNVLVLGPIKAYGSTASTQTPAHYDRIARQTIPENAVVMRPKSTEMKSTESLTSLANQPRPNSLMMRPFSYTSDEVSISPKSLKGNTSLFGSNPNWNNFAFNDLRGSWEGPDLPIPDYSPIPHLKLPSARNMN